MADSKNSNKGPRGPKPRPRHIPNPADEEEKMKKEEFIEPPQEDVSESREPHEEPEGDDFWDQLGEESSVPPSIEEAIPDDIDDSLIEPLVENFETEDIWKNPQPELEPEPAVQARPKLSKNESHFEFEYDSHSSYFFMFGVGGSGKSVILSGLMYYIQTQRLGSRIENLNDKDKDYERLGSKLLQDMMEDLPSGKWPMGTRTLDSASQTFPRLINLSFAPADSKKPTMKFSMMDVSGEDLEKIRAVSDYDIAQMKEGIDCYLNIPDNNLAIICVYPAKSYRYDHNKLSDYIRLFFDELDRRNKGNVPIILAVSQWDLVAEKYTTDNGPLDFIKEEAPLVYGKIHEQGRNTTVMGFSIGDVLKQGGRDLNSYKYDPESSTKLFQWMYQVQMGTNLDQPVKKKTLNFFRSFLNRNKS